MKTNPPKQSALTENSASPVKVTRKMMRERAVQLAARKGGSTHDVSKADWEQAKNDLLSQVAAASREPVHASAAESEGWASPPSSTGHKVPVPSGDDEDEEGRSDPERLVEEGSREATLDRRRQANREGEINP